MNEAISAKFFIAGIMQGSRIEAACHNQNYRATVADLLKRSFPRAVIYDPYANHQESLGYTFETGRSVFLAHNKMCGTEIDVLIAFLPEASMGTAIEMLEGNQNGAVVMTVSPLRRNWAVRFLSDRIYATPEELEKDVRSGEFQRFVEERRKIHQNSSHPH